MKFLSVFNTDTGQWEVTSYDGTITIETESKTTAEWIESLVSDVEQIDTDKISEPEVEGTEGQVLMTDGEGGRSWGTINGAEVKNDTDLVIKEDTSATELKQVEIGTTIYVAETINNIVNYIPYTLVEKRTNSSIILCRDNLLPTTTMLYSHNGNNRLFELDDTPTPNLLDEYLSDTYLPRLSDGMKSLLVNEHFEVKDCNGTHLCSRKVTIPSLSEINSWSIQKKAYKEFELSSAQPYFLRTQQSSGTWGGYRYSTMDSINSAGSRENRNTDSPAYIRPVIAISYNSTIDENDRIITVGTYTGTIDKLQDGNNYYKFADQDARASITAIKDGTSIDSFGDVESALGDKANDSQTIDSTTKTVNGWIEYLVDEIDGVENLIGTGVISNGD